MLCMASKLLANCLPYIAKWFQISGVEIFNTNNKEAFIKYISDKSVANGSAQFHEQSCYPNMSNTGGLTPLFVSFLSHIW